MDWYSDFKKLCNDFNIDNIINKNSPNKKKIKVLELGCGNSTLAHDLCELGYKNISSIDFSHVVIERMKKKYAEDNINCNFY
jgi:2-polyprenyl-3-methyl-5-hydroxy-6-metoxy-1,4-benzoquinol methylase